MKPFDLKRALAGEPVVTRDGRKVHCVLHDPGSPDEEMRVYARYGDESCMCYNAFMENGLLRKGQVKPQDLFMAPIKREAWVNVYPAPNDSLHKGISFLTSHAFSTKGIADSLATGNRLLCIRVEVEE